MICLFICMIELNMENKSKQLEVNSNRENETRKLLHFQLTATSLSEIEIMCSIHR
jgi:hypothetical protein